MKQVQDPELLAEKLRQYRIYEYFSVSELPFQLFRYDKGEILTFKKRFSGRLVFLLEGVVSIDSIRDDGSHCHVCKTDGLTLLGDIEFVQGCEGELWVEAVSDLLCAELPTEDIRPELLRDAVFLRCCLQSVTDKLERILRTEVTATSLEEKLLLYLQYSCPGGRMCGVQAAADQLHCSRRQLQRVLGRLCAEGTLEKTGKGEYRLTGISVDYARLHPYNLN